MVKFSFLNSPSKSAKNEKETSVGTATPTPPEASITEGATTPEMTTSDFDKVLQYFRDEGYRSLSVDKDRNVIVTSVAGNNGIFPLIVVLYLDEKVLSVNARLPVRVPLEQRLLAAEYVARANNGLLVGHFSLDMSDGEICYKGATPYNGGELTPAMVEPLIHYCLGTADKYLPGLMKLIYSQSITPEAAIQEIEQGSGSTSAQAEALVVELLGQAIRDAMGEAASGSSPEEATEDTPAEAICIGET